MSLLAGCGKQDRPYPTSIEELNGLRAGVLLGSICDQLTKENFPDSEISYFNTNADLCEALISNKVEYFLLDTFVVDMMSYENEGVTKIDYSLMDQPIGIATQKSEKGARLAAEYSEFIKNNKEEIDKIVNKWLSQGDYDYDSVEKYQPKLTGENGTLNVSVSATTVPFTYADGDTFNGIEMDIIRMFCEEAGYNLHVEGTDFSSVIAAVTSGKSDIGACCITITEERAKSVNFSEPYTYVGLIPAVAKNPNLERIYYTSGNQLDGTRSACVVGMIDDTITAENYPNAKILYYNNTADTVKAVQTNKADFSIADEFTAYALGFESDDTKLLKDKKLGAQKSGVVFPKGSKDTKLYKQFQEFIAKHKADGKLKEIKAKWLDGSVNDVSEIEKFHPDLTGENGTIRIGTDPASTPISYMGEDGLEGLDIEIANLFAYEYGYDIDWFTADFSGLLPAVASGKVDLAMSCIAITEERAKAVDFTDPYVVANLYPLVAKENKTGFGLESIKEGFNRTFVKEDRWKMVLSGLGYTFRIMIVSTIIGTLLGFLVYLLCRKGNRLANKFFDGFSWLMAGLPMVVVLMIVYYIVFGNSDLTGATVATIAFTVSLMLSVYSMLKTAVKSIDIGQIEGALSLGFTDFQAFSRIVLPQSMTQFIPNYMDELIEMLKGTAIVGYIAVQDLTKVSDVIRARTYDAFFPLIATALIYLVIVVLITIIVKSIFKRYQPKLRSDEQVLKKFKI